jgi:hypothetical protein
MGSGDPPQAGLALDDQGQKRLADLARGADMLGTCAASFPGERPGAGCPLG